MERRGVAYGEVVVLLMGSGPGYVVAYAAAAKIGAITAGINERLSPPEQTACMALAQPALVIAGDEASAALANDVLTTAASAGLSDDSMSAHAGVVTADPNNPVGTLLTGLRVPGATTAPLLRRSRPSGRYRLHFGNNGTATGAVSATASSTRSQRQTEARDSDLGAEPSDQLRWLTSER